MLLSLSIIQDLRTYPYRRGWKDGIHLSTTPLTKKKGEDDVSKKKTLHFKKNIRTFLFFLSLVTLYSCRFP